MTEAQTHRLIHELGEDLTPVRPVARLRVVASAVLAVSGLVLVYGFLRHGVRADWLALALTNPVYGAVLFGLTACGLGATVAALAGAVPGRERLGLGGAALAALGLAAVLVSGVLDRLAGHGFAGSFSDDWMCLRAALLLASLPVGAVLLATSRGWVGRPGRTAIAALAGAAAACALSIHLTCTLSGARHFLLGHASAPLLLALVASLPVALLLRRLAR
jgi:hypothetical protein